ncbi:hypothetical protein H4R33_002071 [Dimargaris cristalligena]|nr:hypothetical protein H4R33_002071 [Dimargaris cristalligena]
MSKPNYPPRWSGHPGGAYSQRPFRAASPPLASVPATTSRGDRRLRQSAPGTPVARPHHHQQQPPISFSPNAVPMAPGRRSPPPPPPAATRFEPYPIPRRAMVPPSYFTPLFPHLPLPHNSPIHSLPNSTDARVLVHQLHLPLNPAERALERSKARAQECEEEVPAVSPLRRLQMRPLLRLPPLEVAGAQSQEKSAVRSHLESHFW